MKEKHLYGDPRVFHAIQTAKRNDNSFKEKESLLTLITGGIKFSQSQVRDIWFQAMELGMEKGLEMGSREGQRVDLFNSCKVPRQKEFLEKFYKLAEEYNCSIMYHPTDGMCIRDLTHNLN